MIYTRDTYLYKLTELMLKCLRLQSRKLYSSRHLFESGGVLAICDGFALKISSNNRINVINKFDGFDRIDKSPQSSKKSPIISNRVDVVNMSKIQIVIQRIISQAIISFLMCITVSQAGCVSHNIQRIRFFRHLFGSGSVSDL